MPGTEPPLQSWVTSYCFLGSQVLFSGLCFHCSPSKHGGEMGNASHLLLVGKPSQISSFMAQGEDSSSGVSKDCLWQVGLFEL